MPVAGNNRHRRVTIKDVARAAGVSVTTVSNVLNGRAEAMASETHSRVQSAIRRLGFRPSEVARGLVRRRTSTIGLVVAEIETPLFLQAIPVVQPLVRAAGYDPLIYHARDAASETEAVGLLLEKEVAGVIFLSTSGYARYDHVLPLVNAGRPVVLVNRPTPAGEAEPRVDRINWDNAGGVASCVEQLARLGHTRIAHLSGPAHRFSTAERLQGYRDGLSRAGLEFLPQYVREADYTRNQDAWREATSRLLESRPRPTAIIAADDTVAAIAIQTARRRGLSVPRDLSICGIDDQPFSALLDPPLTTVRLPVLEAGRRAGELLLARMSGKGAGPEDLLLPCPLVVRNSCAPPPEATGPRDPQGALRG